MSRLHSAEPIHLPRALAGALLITVLAALVYWPSLHGAFILDDDRCVIDHPNIFAPGGLARIWSGADQIEYYPISYSAFWLQWRLWSANPTGYRIANLILHVATSLLLWLTLRKMSIPGAFLAALLFAVHPVNVESVAWIFQFRGLLALFFGLISVFCYLQTEPTPKAHRPPFSRTWGWYALSLLTYVLAMLSKSSIAPLPAILLLIIWWRDRIRIADVLRIAPFFLAAGVLIAITLALQTNTILIVRSEGLWERLAGAGAVLWFYLSTTLLPIHLSFTYPQWHIRAGDPLWWLPLLAVACVTTALFRQRNNRWGRPLFFAWGFFCIALAPVLGLTDAGAFGLSVVWDHYQHLAMLGPIALVAAACGYWNRWTTSIPQKMSLAVAIVLACALSLLTWQENRLYGDPVQLYQDTLAKNPNSWLAHNNLAAALNIAQRPQEAIQHGEQALRLKPDLPEAFYNLGNAHMQLGRLQQAIDNYQQAVHLNPDYAKAHFDLGNALFKADRRPEAIQQYELALRSRPYDSNIYVNQAVALAVEGQLQQAIDRYHRALQLKPDNPDAMANLALAYAAIDRPREAIDTGEKALNLARSQADTALADQIQAWLTKYRDSVGAKK